MKTQWLRLGIVLFLVGTGIGLLFRLPVRATPAGPSPDWPKSVYYVERWRAVEGFMNTPNGYTMLNEPAFAANTAVSGEIAEDASGVPYVKTSPDLFVTKWRVRGHLHFR